jgi:hypothetical protein
LAPRFQWSFCFLYVGVYLFGTYSFRQAWKDIGGMLDENPSTAMFVVWGFLDGLRFGDSRSNCKMQEGFDWMVVVVVVEAVSVPHI